MTLSGSRDSSLCHAFLGISTPYMPSSWLRTTLSKTEPSSLYVVDLTLPRSITNDSSLSGCLWIGMSVPSSKTLSIRMNVEEREGVEPSHDSLS